MSFMTISDALPRAEAPQRESWAWMAQWPLTHWTSSTQWLMAWWGAWIPASAQPMLVAMKNSFAPSTGSWSGLKSVAPAAPEAVVAPVPKVSTKRPAGTKPVLAKPVLAKPASVEPPVLAAAEVLAAPTPAKRVTKAAVKAAVKVPVLAAVEGVVQAAPVQEVLAEAAPVQEVPVVTAVTEMAEPVLIETSVADEAKPAARKRRATPDDLTRLEGIGPKIAQTLVAAGIRHFDTLAATPVDKLQSLMDAAGPRFRLAAPATWPEQAALLAAGDEVGFAQLTAQLTGGRR